ncbi:MAG: 30S ribosomal protein S8 [Candidatus Nanoarchaeia archaeon]
MSQDIVSDALNMIMNAKKAGKQKITIKRYSKLLLNVLEIAKNAGYIEYSIEENELLIELSRLNEIMTIKPRYTVGAKKLDFYARRFLPAKNFGILIVSTNQGLMEHKEAENKNLGGCLIAYMF